jgi:hypothetical protein
MNKRRTKYLRELFRWSSGTVKIRANGELVRDRVRFAIVRGRWVSIPVR